MTGYLGFNDDADDPSDRVTQDEFIAVPGSLLGKAQTAQTVFDNKFLLPFSPERPDFFLVPGDNQVTVLWSRSATETDNPDPFFVVASQPTSTARPTALRPELPRATTWRATGSIAAGWITPSELPLLAQFDYAPDPATGRGLFKDFRGVDESGPGQCAPELARPHRLRRGAPAAAAPGTPFTVGFAEVDLTGTVTQITPGKPGAAGQRRSPGAPGRDRHRVRGCGRRAGWRGRDLHAGQYGGVPFVFIDHTVRNSLRYFYSVTAFDVNSLASGPSSLESARITKAVIATSRSPNDKTETTLRLGHLRA